MEFLEIDSKNIYTSLLYIANFIRSRKVVKGKANEIPELKGFGKAAWNFVFSIYESGWDSLSIDKYNNLFRTKVLNKFMPKVPNNSSSSTLGKSKDKAAEIVKLLPLFQLVYPRKFWRNLSSLAKERILQQRLK